MEARVSTSWQWAGGPYRLAQVIFQILLLASALSIAPLPIAGAANYPLDFDGSGNYSHTDAGASTNTSRFYQLSGP